MPPLAWILWPVIGALAAAATYVLLGVIRPWLARRGTAHPNHRSSHKQPTPQGAGVVVVLMALAAAAALLAVFHPPAGLGLHIAAVTAAALGLLALGFYDDGAPLPASLRLAVQFLAVLLVVATLPGEFRLAPFVPLIVERAVLILIVLWAINLANFMDGIDWISATETLSITAGIGLLAALGLVPLWLGAVAVGLFASMAGFMPWNTHPARLFLGDAGSLPLGLLLALLMIHTALAGAYAAALILPLYYLVDATWTLAMRLLRGERIWEAHREHFYQRAVIKGWSVPRVIAHIAALNVALIVIAAEATRISTLPAAIVGLALAGTITGATLFKMARSES